MRDPTAADASYGLGYRHVIASLVLILGIVVAIFQAGVTVGVVSMTSKNSSNPDFEEFHWSSVGKNTVLSSFFWGLLLGAIPAGHFGQRLNVKSFVISAIVVAALVSSLLPTVAKYGGWQGLSGLVVLQGLMSGVVMPCSYIIISKWAPRSETARLIAIINLGNPLGTAMALPLCGLLAKGPGGWPSIYYFGTLFALVWAILFFIFASPSPSTSRFISEAERNFIELSQKDVISKKAPQTPWRNVLTSRAVLIFLIAEACNGWGASIILTELPSYVHDVLHLSILMNGIVSALPSVCIALLLFPISWTADYVTKKNIISKWTSRMICTFIGMGINGTLLILTGIVGHNVGAAIFLICSATACATFSIPGLHTSPLDIAPNFAGVLMGLGSFGSHLSGVLAPMTVGAIVTNNQPEQWMWVFIETGGVLISGSLIYILFGTSDLQSWNKQGDDDVTENNTQTEVSVPA